MNVNIPTNFENDNYGYIFHLLRIAKNWKLKDIESQFNISKSYVTVVEKTNVIKDKMLEKFCFIYDISRSQLERIHNTSKIKHKWDYQKTMRDIIDYYLDKNILRRITNMQNALEMVFNIDLYIHSAGTKTLKDVISHTYKLLSDLPLNVFVSVDNNEPNDLDAIKDSDYYANYIVTGSYVDKYSNVIICAISQEDFKNGCEK